MGPSEHIIRQGSEAAGAGLPNGDGLFDGMEEAARYRVPEVPSYSSSSSVPEGSSGQGDIKGLRRSEGRLLPVRQEPKERRDQEDERGHAERTKARASGNNYNPRSGQKESRGESTAWAGSNTTEDGDAEGRTSSSDGSVHENEKKGTNCFLDKGRVCDASCTAYKTENKEPCRILNYMGKVILSLGPTRSPIQPPKVL